MVHSGGFEPPTARFVAEYSIQLSYECTEGAHYKLLILLVKLFESMIYHQNKTLNQTTTYFCKMAERGGFEPPTPF